MRSSFGRNRGRIFNYNLASICLDRRALNYGDAQKCAYASYTATEITYGGPYLYPANSSGFFYRFPSCDGGKFVVHNPTGVNGSVFYYGPSGETLCNDQVQVITLNAGATVTCYVRKGSHEKSYLFVQTVPSFNITVSNWTDSCP